jgi:acyl-CoA dehydrogenase
MDFAKSAKTHHYHQRLTQFMIESVFPAEAAYYGYRLQLRAAVLMH